MSPFSTGSPVFLVRSVSCSAPAGDRAALVSLGVEDSSDAAATIAVAVSAFALSCVAGLVVVPDGAGGSCWRAGAGAGVDAGASGACAAAGTVSILGDAETGAVGAGMAALF